MSDYFQTIQSCPKAPCQHSSDRDTDIANLTADLAAERAELERLREAMELAWVLIANGQYWDRTDGRRYGEWNEARAKWRDEHWHPALDRTPGGPS